MQAPQSSPPQPNRVPFNPSSLRRAKINGVVPSTRTSTGDPLTVSVIPMLGFLLLAASRLVWAAPEIPPVTFEGLDFCLVLQSIARTFLEEVRNGGSQIFG